uniref:Serpentine Receptor, class H n=2 Tax=Caenorhabditis japonica TaxID=281687 RepID=A0A8R1DFU7_CAEJA
MCFPDTSYLSSPDFLIKSSHILVCVDAPILSYGAYCILFKTPDPMSSIKWLMFNLHFFSTMLDLTLSFFGIPYIFLPLLGGYGLGIIDSPQTWIHVGVSLVVAVDTSIILIYENRYYILYARDSFWARVRKPCLTLMFLALISLCQIPFLMIPEQDTARKLFMDSLSCPSAYSFGDRKMFVLASSPQYPLLFLIAGFCILSPPALSFFTLTFYHLIKGTSTVSRRTQQLQRQVIIALTFQSSFLVACLDGPFFAVVATIVFQYHYQGLNNMIFILLAMHGIGSTIVMVLVHRPYRDFTFSGIRGRCGKQILNKSRSITSTVALIKLV